jgi:enediyne polyketide synthase
MTHSIAIIGLACEYPDARSPAELWDNVLARRQAFRRLPAERLRLEDYASEDRSSPDRTYATDAAVLAGYEFDRVRFRVATETYRATDPSHWLALDVAARALEAAQFASGDGLPRETTGVLVGNTLTGEFSRANVLRLRWPYVARRVAAALETRDWPRERVQELLGELERSYKSPFPPVGEETLAGGLSNTIAGRISNHFDLKGGGYTLDGACASSLLAVAQACSALAAGDLDVVLAGGVDLSLDPFELVGFAKAGALADDAMRVYDARSAGFWPGEGCGFAVLMRLDDALAQGRPVVAVIRGWGISSDGQGGITRPEVEGQLLALRRAYRRAGYGIDTVSYFEGHGTGTSVGDATELRALSRARREADERAPPAAIGSIKANIGHTKAAAGIAGLIKAALAAHHQVLPPTTACDEPHPELCGEWPALRTLPEGELFPAYRPLRAGISAMGFGGINAHVTLEAPRGERRTRFTPHEREAIGSAQDTELLVLDAEDNEGLRTQIDRLLATASGLSRSELGDLAASLARSVRGRRVRAAVVASHPRDWAERLQALRNWIENGERCRVDVARGTFLGDGTARPRIGFLFPGQGVPDRRDGGALGRRFPSVREFYETTTLPAFQAGSTAVAQPAIVAASLAALRILARLGIEADIAVGHSLGELTALHWAGACDERALLRLTIARGQAMADHAEPGCMASIAADPDEVAALINGDAACLAGMNSPRQTVISGAETAVATVVARARKQGLSATRLAVSLAFHSPRVAAAVPDLERAIERERLVPLVRRVSSTVTGGLLPSTEDLSRLLSRQVTSPVRFEQAVREAGPVDLWIEVGPGRILAGLVEAPVTSLDAGGPSLGGLLAAVGASYGLGAEVNLGALFQDRFTRPFDPDQRPRFLANPCEQAPQYDLAAPVTPVGPAPAHQPPATEESVQDFVRRVVAEKTGFPLAAVAGDHHLLHDLHLNSITIGQIIAEAAHRLGIAGALSLTPFVDGTIADVARGLDEASRSTSGSESPATTSAPQGVDTWVRTFAIKLIEGSRPRGPKRLGAGVWDILAPADHPLAGPLERAFVAAESGGGLVVALPLGQDERSIRLLLEATRRFHPGPGRDRFVLVQQAGLGAGFVRSLFLETRGAASACVIDLPFDAAGATEWIVNEALGASGFVEVHYDRSGTRREPRLGILPLTGPATVPLGPEDVVLVSGGGKGIASACARGLAQRTGARLALLGRTRPTSDPALAANLRAIEATGVAVRYLAADVTDEDAVRAAVHALETDLGPVTAILHAAGRNEPTRLDLLDEREVLATLAPKIQGARNLVAACRDDRLCWFVGFGSIIARTGMRGEAHYALANEILARFTEELGRARPACRCLTLEWSVWSGLGMGERLGRIESLRREGIEPIPADRGVDILLEAMSRAPAAPSLVVTGRFGDPPTLRLERPERPLWRFLEQAHVDIPGVELVIDAELSTETDLYLDDHVFRGERLFPAVLGLEAMAQVAATLTGSPLPPQFENVHFDRPVVVPSGRSTTIRLAGLVRSADRAEVVLRCSSTGFNADHFRATCVFQRPLPGETASSVPQEAIALDPQRLLYGSVLFQTGRLQRLLGYRQLMATHCIAEVDHGRPASWFGPYVPSELILGDPGTRDATLHAIQACIPHATILPIGVDRLTLWEVGRDRRERLQVYASERAYDVDTLTYDVDVLDQNGRTRERWEGLRLRVVERGAARPSWEGPLLGTYAQRRLRELLPGVPLNLAVERDADGEPAARSQRTIERARQAPATRKWCAARADYEDLSLAVTSPVRVACEIRRTDDLREWDPQGLAVEVSVDAREPAVVSATRTSVAATCLARVGGAAAGPLRLLASTGDGWVILRAGTFSVATLALPSGAGGAPLIVGILAETHGDAL